MTNPLRCSDVFARLQCVLVSICFLASTLQPSGLLAQGADVDIEFPEITMDQDASGVRGQPQTISLIATDNRAIASVTLFFRFKQSGPYREQSMRAVGAASRYETVVDTAAAAKSDGIDSFQYYIKVIDSSGNTRFRGFTFSPLLWKLTAQYQGKTSSSQTADLAADLDADQASGQNAQQSTEQTADKNWGQVAGQPETEQQDTTVRKSGKRTLYTVLGLLAVLAVAGAASSSGGGGGGAEPCTADGCSLTITGQPP